MTFYRHAKTVAFLMAAQQYFPIKWHVVIIRFQCLCINYDKFSMFTATQITHCNVTFPMHYALHPVSLSHTCHKLRNGML